MPRQNHCVPDVHEYILYFLVKRACRQSHRFVSQIQQPFFPYPDAANATIARYVEREIGTTRLQITIDIAAGESDVSVANNLLKRV